MTYPAGDEKQAHQRVGRYEIFDPIAAGGMATVHLARLSGAEGFSRVVAVKRMHPHFLVDPAFKAMFIAEARVAARVRHPNVVPILDVLAENDEIVIIMDYVHGESLMALTRAARKSGTSVPIEVASAVMVGVLQGLHAAHTAQDEQGRPLGLVHRDVSPHNVLVGTDGVARVLDFGIAKAIRAREAHGDTDPGVLKGKFSYIAPELIQGASPSPQSDLFSASVVFWELLSGTKLFHGVNEQERLVRIVQGNYASPSSVAPQVPQILERIVMRGLELEPEQRHASALEMAIELENAVPVASQRIVGEWVSKLAADVLAQRTELIHQVEASSISVVRRSVAPGASGPAVVSATPPGFEAPPPVAPEPRAAPGKQRHFGLTAAAVAGVVLVVLGLVLALRSPAHDATTSAHNAQAALQATSPAPSALPAANPPTTSPVTAVPAKSTATVVAAAPDAPSTASSPATPHHAPSTRSPAPAITKAPGHAGPKRRAAYLPNEL
jgi:serine/threonine-protein kinase